MLSFPHHSSLFQNSINMSLFDYFKTESPVFNAIITTFVLSLMGYIARQVQDFDFQNINTSFSIIHLKYLLYKKNIIILEGKKSTYSSGYEKNICVSSLYSDRFNDMLNLIMNTFENNPSVYEIKELGGSSLSHGESKGFTDYLKELFLVTQKNAFLINNQLKIYALVETYTENHEDKESLNSKNPVKIDKFVIKIFSFETSLFSVKQFIDCETERYLRTIEDERFNKKFIYTLTKTKYEEHKNECWSECIFESSKTFSNLFFKGKEDIIHKLDFFINNKQWYYDMGIPYTLGIGLHGPPGTGKTSLIKCIANQLNRHVINLSLKLIKTKKQLDDFFFENRYNNSNKKGSIGFGEKIIVIEDIDCIGEIVLKRETKQNKITKASAKKDFDINALTKNSSVKVGDVLKTIADKNNEDSLKISKLLVEEEPITLDDILNLWDGLRETPGRVLIISSNCYGDLDPALIRPGRIDITLELGNPDHEIISQLYTHLTKEKLPPAGLKKIKPNFYSQAEIINMYLSSNKNSKDFMNRLLLNIKNNT
jgi:hypothetical protein